MLIIFFFFVFVGTASNAGSKGGTRGVNDTEAAAAALDASRLAGPDPAAAAQSQSQDRSKGQCTASLVCLQVCLNVLTRHTH